MGGLNRVPFGFLDLVQATVSGRAPSEYTDEVRTTFDMSPFYLSQRKASESLAAPLGLGDSNVITVPNNETWLLYSHATRIVMTSGESAAVAIQLTRVGSDPTPQSPFPVAGFVIGEGNAVQDRWHTELLPVPIILQPGEEVRQLIQDADFAADRATTLAVGYARMTV